MHDFPVYIFICPPYSLPKPATETKSASSFILSRPHRLLEGARFETSESHSFLLAPIQRVDDEHSETEGASAKIKKILTSFQKPQSPVIYVVEEHERAAALTEAAPYISQMRIRNDPMERQIQKRVPPSCPHLFRKGKNQYKLKTYRETQDSRKSLQGRNDRRLMYGARHTRGSCHFCICGADLESWVHCVVHILILSGQIGWYAQEIHPPCHCAISLKATAIANIRTKPFN